MHKIVQTNKCTNVYIHTYINTYIAHMRHQCTRMMKIAMKNQTEPYN